VGAAEFWAVFADSRLPMLVLDDDGVYVDANAAACRGLRRSRDEIVGRHLGALSDPSVQPDLDRFWQELRREGQLVTAWELTRSDGEPLAVDVICVGDIPAPKRYLTAYVARSNGASNGHLSPREREVTQLLASGLNGEAIAQKLFLSPETVRTHIRNAMDHLHARSRAHLVALALREGLIDGA